ncbi:hypothetical protein B0H19DRAFT_1094541 [Mycena capillaripes]|nr:hypothetical protein B0H19DRAFT_1094541 [Mycena capillaripes]
MQSCTTDSAADLKPRDQPLESQKEIARLQRRVDIAKGTVDSLNGKMCDLEQQGLRLAKSLGFDTVYAAQAFIDIADEQTPYKELAEQIESLQTKILQERKDSEMLRTQLQEMQSERDALKAAVDNSAMLSTINATNHTTSQRQFHALQRRYDELQAVKLRAEDRYKVDYRIFNKLKAYVLSEEIQDMETQLRIDAPQLTKDEKKRRRAEITALTQEKMKELEATENLKGKIPEDDTEDFMSQSDKENQRTPVPETQKRRIFISLSMSSITASSPRSSPPTRVPLHPQNLVVKQQSSPVILIPSSSDTEETPYPGSTLFASLKNAPNAVPPRPAASMSSETEDDSSQEPFHLLKVTPIPVKVAPLTQEDRKPLIITSTPKLKPPLAGRSILSPQPGSLQFVDQRSKSKTRHSDGGLKSTTPADEQRPTKKRRVTSPGPGPSSASTSISELGASAATPLYVGSGDTPRRKRDRDMSASTGQRLKGTVKDRGKGKQAELLKMDTSTPVTNARASSSKHLADYSAYKGRGRYATDATDGNATINAKFAIDPEQNGGRDFQYDEVVRGREERRHMEAEDCECCRDYYQNIGPMPERLQAPLWRTPPSSPGGSKPCLRAGSARDENADITSHKKSISRHRHHWARGKTPPSYWSIGFPTTQEVVSINEKAREMHQEKQKMVQEEANRDGGRYKKR